ncbi:MAG TPA: sugar transferase [Solirubrobacteraceae bacterium]|jgi:lipopolysaccharide/colanic/teichoic acid biosynthesis glycosyltransferase|nr:sugar transferase [Solirubrobacteraceae bacterium]
MGIHAGTTLDRELRATPTNQQALVLVPPLAAPAPRRTSAAWPRAKRVADVLLAVVLLVAVLPLLLVIGLAIRLDTPGPLFFRQQRLGRDRRTFTVLKFRTMHDGVSPEAHRLYIAKLAAEGEAGEGLKKLTADPRVTRVGAFLRRTSLDELPQLINIVRGEMSVIGPRPALEYELEHYDPGDYARFDVRPGLTGLWQVSGRNSIGFRGMLELDAQYARTTSARLDATILLRTPLALLRGNAA